MNGLPSLDWQVENLRMTAFPSPSARFTQEPSWWTDLMKEAPETSVRQARRQLLRQEGQLSGGRLTLTIQPNRINWQFAATREEEEEVALPIIGPFEKTLDIFLPLMVKWFELDTCPPLSRLAFGAVLLFPVDSLQSGYQQLDRLLPSIELDTEGISDFLYQINRPKSTTTQIENLQINRLSKWSVATLRFINVIMDQTPITVTPNQGVSACRLELDINTQKDFDGELLPEQLPEIFNELVNFGEEIASDGDIG